MAALLYEIAIHADGERDAIATVQQVADACLGIMANRLNAISRAEVKVTVSEKQSRSETLLDTTAF